MNIHIWIRQLPTQGMSTIYRSQPHEVTVSRKKRRIHFSTALTEAANQEGWKGYPVGRETATAVTTNHLLSSLQNKPVSSEKKLKMPSRDIKEKISGNQNQLSARMTGWSLCDNTLLKSFWQKRRGNTTVYIMIVTFKVSTTERDRERERGSTRETERLF